MAKPIDTNLILVQSRDIEDGYKIKVVDDKTGKVTQQTRHYEYEFGQGGKDGSDGDKRKGFDCSHLVNKMVRDAGYKVPYEYTGALVNSKYYNKLSKGNVKPGDVVVWSSNTRAHTGVVVSYDAKTGKGTMYNASSNKPGVKNDIGISKFDSSGATFLRPKEKYHTLPVKIKPDVPKVAAPAPNPGDKKADPKVDADKKAGGAQAQPSSDPTPVPSVPSAVPSAQPTQIDDDAVPLHLQTEGVAMVGGLYVPNSHVVRNPALAAFA